MFSRLALRALTPLLLTTSLVGCASSPPVQEMSDARQAIMAAEEADAEAYAPATLADARRYLDIAEQLIRDEVYGPARMNAVRAKNRAVRALIAAEAAIADELEAD
jgi:Domain of unknown function (DUF4398)